jgi:tRNA-dihydrouridine synthase B
MQNPTFFVRDIPVCGDLILSPMDGYSDQPFRALCRSLGSAMSYTEFINAIDVVGYHPHLERKLAFQPEERPVVYQVFDNDPERLLQAAVRLQERRPDIIDVNLGCSAKCVSGRGAGAGLLREPEKVSQIFSLLTSHLSVPVTAKMRLGWDDGSRNYLEIAQRIVDGGGALIAVHGRTREQKYSGIVDWDAIAEIKRSVPVPVIANGDVRTVADIEAIKAYTGADAVMIGRAVIGNPWIFSRLDVGQVPLDMLMNTVRRHLDAMLAFYGTETGLLRFRKHADRYLAPLNPDPELRRALMTAPGKEEFLETLATLAGTIQPAV